MDKVILILVLALLSTTVTQAQNFSEWFRQKQTQKKYLIEQIAALKVYSEFLEKGYEIGKKGLGTISQIKNGEFNLHRDFFGSLSVVNPAIKRDPRISDIEQMQIGILKLKDKVLRNAQKSNLVTEKENQYFTKVFDRLIENCSHILEELADVALSNNLTMKDDQRMIRIEKLHGEMMDNYRFADQFKKQIIGLLASRSQVQREISTSNWMFEIK